MGFLDVIRSYIINRQQAELITALNSQPLHNIKLDALLILAREIYRTLIESEAPSSYIEAVTNVFVENNIDEERMNFRGRFLTSRHGLDDGGIQYLLIHGFNAFESIMGIIKGDSSENSRAALSIIFELSDLDFNLDLLEKLHGYTIQYENTMAQSVVEYQISKKKRGVPKPSYITRELNKTEDELFDLIPDIEDPRKLFQDTEELALLLTLGHKGDWTPKQRYEDLQKEVLEKLEDIKARGDLDHLEVYKILVSGIYFAANERDRLLNRILGPANPIQDSAPIDMDSYCGLFGGCRMFCCNHFEREGHWFEDRICRTCNRKFEKNELRYAFRTRRVMGGWVGLYCSQKCELDDKESEFISGLPYESAEPKDPDEQCETASCLRKDLRYEMKKLLSDTTIAVLKRDGVEEPIDNSVELIYEAAEIEIEFKKRTKEEMEELERIIEQDELQFQERIDDNELTFISEY